MITIKILVVGTVDIPYLKMGVKDFLTRLTHYCQLEIIEIPVVTNKSVKENINQESILIMNRLTAKYHDYEKILLDVSGQLITSVQLAHKIADNQTYGQGKMLFIIGGSDGVNNELRNKVTQQISFGRVTFPHQLMRLLLLEQIYRSFKIIRGETYHK